MFLVDTDVLSLLRRPERSPGISRWMAGQRTADLYVSVVSVAEIERGITRRRERDPTFARALATWLDNVLSVYGDRILLSTHRPPDDGAACPATSVMKARTC